MTKEGAPFLLTEYLVVHEIVAKAEDLFLHMPTRELSFTRDIISPSVAGDSLARAKTSSQSGFCELHSIYVIYISMVLTTITNQLPYYRTIYLCTDSFSQA